MKKLTLLVLCFLFLAMMAACVDYSAMTELSTQKQAAEPTASAGPMVRQSAYEDLLESFNTLNDQVNTLLDEKAASTQETQAAIDENTALAAVVSDIELSVYRSVISKDALGAYFGMIKGAEKLANGDVLLTVQPLSLVNETADASLYDKEVIREIYTGLTLEAADVPEVNFTVQEQTMVAYNDETHYTRDVGFFTYVVDEMASAKALYDTNHMANPTLLPGPVFIFLAIGDDAVMILEK